MLDDSSLGPARERPRIAQTLKKGLRILKCFDVVRPEWTVKEMASATGLPMATVYRFVTTLQNDGFLELDPRSHRYHLGGAMLKTAYVLASHGELIRIARPHMQRLTDSTSEASMLVVPSNGESLVIDAVPTPHPFSPKIFVGSSYPGLAPVHGKIFAAYATAESREAMLAGPHIRHTEHTVVDPHVLREELQQVRREGVAFGAQQSHLGAGVVAAPVFDSMAQVVASLGIMAPVERFGPIELRGYAKAVIEAAAALSRDLGYLGSPQVSSPAILEGAGKDDSSTHTTGQQQGIKI